jgi:hypothetical protein
MKSYRHIATILCISQQLAEVVSPTGLPEDIERASCGGKKGENPGSPLTGTASLLLQV